MNRHKLFVSLFALVVIFLAISFGYFLGNYAQKKQDEATDNWTRLEIILTRQCRAEWPLKDDEYCVEKIKVYREDT